ncbi:hypothetical protein [Streptomyces geranii]|uniref:hypothetical protein n=1 Tax=Streptomyces geranii TaxID=2058923 RepID=UPI000D03FF38|nr:hypothetical protein [Streptomyces geranii]
MRQSRTAVNRFALGAVGLALLLAGSWLVAADRAVADRLPSWWPSAETGAGTGSVLLDRDRLAQLRGTGWWTPTIMAVTIALTVLLTCWALAQLHSGPARRLALPTAGATVRPQALAEALTARTAALPGVARCRVGVRPRSRQRLDIGLRVWLRPDTPPEEVLPALCAVVAEAEEAAAPYTAHTRLRLGARPHRRPRVR